MRPTDTPTPCGRCGEHSPALGHACWSDERARAAILRALRDAEPPADGGRWRVVVAEDILARLRGDDLIPGRFPPPPTCTADEGMTGIRCMNDVGHPLPHRGWCRDASDTTGEYAVYIEWPVPNLPDPAPDEPAELRDLPLEVRSLVHAVDRLRDRWADSDTAVRRDLWTAVHAANDAVWDRVVVR